MTIKRHLYVGASAGTIFITDAHDVTPEPFRSQSRSIRNSAFPFAYIALDPPTRK